MSKSQHRRRRYLKTKRRSSTRNKTKNRKYSRYSKSKRSTRIRNRKQYAGAETKEDKEEKMWADIPKAKMWADIPPTPRKSPYVRKEKPRPSSSNQPRSFLGRAEKAAELNARLKDKKENPDKYPRTYNSFRSFDEENDASNYYKKKSSKQDLEPEPEPEPEPLVLPPPPTPTPKREISSLANMRQRHVDATNKRLESLGPDNRSRHTISSFPKEKKLVW